MMIKSYPIKFRVWHKNNKKMYQVEKLELGNNEFYPNVITTTNEYFTFNEYVLMQFTGSYDVHKEEIYVGDVLLSPKILIGPFITKQTYQFMGYVYYASGGFEYRIVSEEFEQSHSLGDLSTRSSIIQGHIFDQKVINNMQEFNKQQIESFPKNR